MGYLSNPQNINFGTINQTANTQALTWRFYVTTAGDPVDRTEGKWGIGKSQDPSRTESYYENNGGAPRTVYCNDSATVECDETYYYNIQGLEYDASSGSYVLVWSQAKSGSTRILGLSNAATPVLDDAPTLDNATTTTIRVNNLDGLGATDSFTPKTSETSVTLYIQYKVTGADDSTYSNFSALNASVTGYSDTTIGTTTVTGLTPDTNYSFRYHLDRTGTSNGTTSYYSGVSTLSTLPNDPDVTTVAANGIGTTGATLRATVDHNGFDGTLSWRYVLTSAYVGPPNDTEGTEVSYGSVTGDGTYSAVTGTLTQNEGYTFWAIYEYTDGGTQKDYGSALTFTTQADPATGGDKADFMIPLQFDGQRGVAKTVYFTLRYPADSNNNTFYVDTPPVQADVKIMQDGTYDDTSDNAPTQPDAANLPEVYSLVVSAEEMVGDVVDVIISDADGPAFRDLHIQVRTKMDLSELDVDATNHGDTNVTAVKFTGKGTGHGLDATGGATGNDIDGVLGNHVVSFGTVQSGTSSTVRLAASENASNDIYNECIVLIYSQDGDEQARLVTDYDGSNKDCTVDSNWIGSNPASGDKYIILPGSRAWQTKRTAELSAVPTATSTFNDKVQMIWQRFAYKVDQTATTQTWYKSTGTSYGTKTVSDDGTTQILGALS